MANGDATKCIEHTGCVARISNLEDSDKSQWSELKEAENRMNAISARINVILGSVVVSCILLVINLLIGKS